MLVSKQHMFRKITKSVVVVIPVLMTGSYTFLRETD